MAIADLKLKQYQKTFDSKTVIFKEGGEGTDLYILIKGSVSVLKGVKKVAEIAAAGSYFGEMSPLLGTPRSATIVTNEVSTFMIIPAKSLSVLINDAGLKLAKLLAGRVGETTQKLVKAQDDKNELDLRCRGDYQKLVKVIACIYMQSKLPQLKSLLDYSKKMSGLATGGYVPQWDEMHMDEYIKKSSEMFWNKV